MVPSVQIAVLGLAGSRDGTFTVGDGKAEYRGTVAGVLVDAVEVSGCFYYLNKI